ncbi:hypothetical protein [Arthrobacter sp. Soil736]|nr:hypothetical protein [Arthrobacter sp. Soil736]
MELTGTIEAPDGRQARITAVGEDYATAHAALLELIPDEHKLIVIRTQ